MNIGKRDTAMDSWVRCWAGAISTLASVGVAGCATGPDPEVVRAQAAVQEARADQAVADYAPTALRDAEQALAHAADAARPLGGAPAPLTQARRCCS